MKKDKNEKLKDLLQKNIKEERQKGNLYFNPSPREISYWVNFGHFLKRGDK